ncbi:MAG: 1-deoxy-D-xylulose-5-phosphate synthase N-terminal domain-containing protein, partial [Gammaproteobacteria bacterium]
MMSTSTTPLLDSIDTPEDLRRLDEAQLPRLARELRSFLLESVSSTGGHLSAGLGTIELTIALHYVFNTPRDHLVWDVGHQTYPHKILTGRRQRMPSLRQRGGLAGFPKRGESEFDAFGTGHSSTSISAALGMCIADQQRGHNNKSIAVIGDGAMTAGMAFEALNHAGDTDADLLVVLNDNDMSISANVGGLSNHLTRLLSGSLYSTIREGGKRVLENLPGPVHELARRTEEHVKGMVAPGTLFEELGFNYFGPIDGHDLSTLLPTLRNLAHQKGPRLLHVVTRKGKGYFPAEDDPSKYHGVGSFDTSTGESHHD